MPEDPATILTEAGIEVPGECRITGWTRFRSPHTPDVEWVPMATAKAALIAVCKLAAEQKRNFNGACQNEEDALEKLAAVTTERDYCLSFVFDRYGHAVSRWQRFVAKVGFILGCRPR